MVVDGDSAELAGVVDGGVREWVGAGSGHGGEEGAAHGGRGGARLGFRGGGALLEKSLLVAHWFLLSVAHQWCATANY
jgi:hypothetical protein